MKDLITLGERLRYARKKMSLSQEKLANIANVSQGMISKIERGDQESSTHVNELAKILKCNAYWLATGKESYSLEQALKPKNPDLRYINENFESLTDDQKKRLIDSLVETIELNRIKSG